jgi:hypothetical protein
MLRMTEGNVKFADYVRNLNDYNIISYPPDNVFSPCSMYIHDSMMLTNLQMLNVLSGGGGGGGDIAGISIMPIQKARNTGQPVYPTPNIYYAARGAVAANTNGNATAAAAAVAVATASKKALAPPRNTPSPE